MHCWNFEIPGSLPETTIGLETPETAMGKTFETGLLFLEILGFFVGQTHVVNYLQRLLVDSFDICHANMLCSYSIFTMFCSYSIFMLCSLVRIPFARISLQH